MKNVFDNKQIELSREVIRKKLLEQYAKLLGVNKEDLDFDDTSFSSFIINALSVLSSDTLVYSAFTLNESFLVTARMPESILNWAKYIDYFPKNATSAEVSLLIKMPNATSIKEFVIPEGHVFKTNDNIVFRSKYKYEWKNNRLYTYKNKIPILSPYIIDEENNLVFTINAIQKDLYEEEFTIPTLNKYEFYSKTLEIPEDNYITDIKVFIDNEEWKLKRIITSDPFEKTFEWIVIDKKLKISFGNDLFGKQPANKLVKVLIYTSKGKKGNVSAGTITNGDPIYTSTNPPIQIEYTVTNPEPARGGTNSEPLSDIKRNAPKSLSMLHRVVSKQDYKNIFDIMFQTDENYKSIKVLPILKRSDLVTNDIFVYTTLEYKDELVPANTIYFKLPKDKDYIKQFTEIDFDGKQYILPFELLIDRKLQIAKYRFIPKESILEIDSVLKSNDIAIINFKVLYNNNDETFDLIISVVSEKDNIDQYLSVRIQDKFIKLKPTTKKQIIQNIYQFIYKIDKDTLLKSLSIDIFTLVDNIVKLVDSTKYQVIDLDNMEFSYIEKLDDNNYYITDIPVIEKTWFDNLSDNDKEYLIQHIIAKFIRIQSYTDKRMANVRNSIKFVKTIGKLRNLQYSTPSYIVKGIVHNSYELKQLNLEPGDIIAISDPIPHDDELYKYAGYIAIYNGNNTYTYQRIGIGTIIKNLNDGYIYSTDGRRWFIPDYESPLNFDIEIHVSTPDNTIYEKAVNTIIDYVNSRDIEESLYLSELYSRLSSINNVVYVRIIYPYSDIIYRDILDNINTKEDLIKYVPESYYTKEENIRITILNR